MEERNDARRNYAIRSTLLLRGQFHALSQDLRRVGYKLRFGSNISCSTVWCNHHHLETQLMANIIMVLKAKTNS